MNRVITSSWTDTASVIVRLKVSGDPKLIRVVIPGRERREMERWHVNCTFLRSFVCRKCY